MEVNLSPKLNVWSEVKVTNEGIPAAFTTERVQTVQSIINLMFPQNQAFVPLMFFKAPPLSGKTGMAFLLSEALRKRNINAVYLSALRMEEGEKFSAFFERIADLKWSDFLSNKKARVLIVDEAQITYSDVHFWEIVKLTMQRGEYPNLRVVLFSSYGSFDPYRKTGRDSTPIAIPEANTFGLQNDDKKPGLYLTQTEFKEMITGTVLEQLHELAWTICSAHIGIAFAVVEYVHARFKNTVGSVPLENIEDTLRSSKLLDSIEACRGIPTLISFQKVVEGYKVSDEVTRKMENYLNRVSLGEVVFAKEKGLSPGSNHAIALLTKIGFLYENQEGQLHFSSAMHCKIWLKTTRKEPLNHLLKNSRLEDFMISTIGRMSSNRLLSISTENNDIIRERQLQMELYTAIVSCVPLSWLVTSEWRTKLKDGYIDLVIRGKDLNWFIELLVDGDDAKGHEERFQTGQKYYASCTLLPNAKYVLIDFRQHKTVRKFRENFLYVSFGVEFKAATIWNEKKSVTVRLS